jgi:peroxiredoxin Q/BCP
MLTGQHIEQLGGDCIKNDGIKKGLEQSSYSPLKSTCYTHSMLVLNSPLPQFSLPDQDGVTHTSQEYKGKWLIVYFYPKDDTPGCTKEACGLRDSYEEFAKNNITVVGISKDSVKSHKKFQEKYHLPFTLLSDPTTETIQKFDSWGKKKFMGREYMGIMRNTFLIDPTGKIVKIYENVDPTTHAAKILEDFSILSGTSATA